MRRSSSVSCFHRVWPLLSLTVLLLVLLALGSTTTAAAAATLRDGHGWSSCEPRSLQASGYISIVNTKNESAGATKHLFYWLLSPREQPAAGELAPVLLWLSGGPGVSSLVALLTSHGPCLMNETSASLYDNPYAWNKKAYLLFVDQPVGVGYSYSDETPEASYVTSEAEVAADMYLFLQGFARKFKNPSFAAASASVAAAGGVRQLFLVGESFAGHYVPSIADHIRSENEKLAAAAAAATTAADDDEGGTATTTATTTNLYIHLQGIAVGNGWVDPYTQMPSYAELAYDWCKTKLGQPCITAAQHAAMLQELPGCQEALAQCNNAALPFANGFCLQAGTLCRHYMSYYMNTSRSPYSIRGTCDGSELCSPMDQVTAFFLSPKVRATLGVAAAAQPWTISRHEVGNLFAYDSFKTVNATIPRLLAAGLRVWMYAGDLDYICNWIGTKAWLLALQWPGAAGFAAASDTEFVVDGQWAGKERTYGNLTFVQIYDSGHMVPTDTPVIALHMIERFVQGVQLSS